MKKLQTSDVFSAMRIVKASGIRDELKPIFIKAADGKHSVEDIGIEAILTVIEAASGTKVEKAIYEFLSAPFEMSVEDVASLQLDCFMANLKELAKENDIAGFFKSLSDLMSLKSLT